jgi:transposase-like protein
MSNGSIAADRWRAVVRRQESSRLSVAAFCRRSGIPQASFYAWRRKLREAETFAEVQVAASAVEGHLAESALRRPTSCVSTALELVLAGGRRIVVRPGFDRATLLALIDAVEDDAWTCSTQESSRAAGEMDIAAGRHRHRGPHPLNAKREGGA